jgi:hypothetical protein
LILFCLFFEGKRQKRDFYREGQEFDWFLLSFFLVRYFKVPD